MKTSRHNTPFADVINMANALTTARFLCGVLLLFFPAFSRRFLICYLLGGITDAMDGFAARRLGKATAFGAKYDTAADAVFMLAAVIKVAGTAVIPKWLLIWIGVIFIQKALNAAVGIVKYHRFVTVHSVVNKVCGVVVFLLPLLIGGEYPMRIKAAGMVFGCLFASAAAGHEFICILNGHHGK